MHNNNSSKNKYKPWQQKKKTETGKLVPQTFLQKKKKFHKLISQTAKTCTSSRVREKANTHKSSASNTLFSTLS